MICFKVGLDFISLIKNPPTTSVLLNYVEIYSSFSNSSLRILGTTVVKWFTLLFLKLCIDSINIIGSSELKNKTRKRSLVIEHISKNIQYFSAENMKM